MSGPSDKNNQSKSSTGILAAFFKVKPSELVPADIASSIILSSEALTLEQLFDYLENGLQNMNHAHGDLFEPINMLFNRCAQVRDSAIVLDENCLIKVNQHLLIDLNNGPLKANHELIILQKSFTQQCQKSGFNIAIEAVVLEEAHAGPRQKI